MHIKNLCLYLGMLMLMVGCATGGKAPDEKVDLTVHMEHETEIQSESEAVLTEDLFETETEAFKGVVVLDPGHQAKGNYDKEPVGPGSSVMKAKVSSGTSGVSTGLPEYQLNLQIGLALRDALEDQGYFVYLTRETNDVDISNVERALYASEVGGDIFIRIHADGSESPLAAGAMAVCQTPSSPYQDLYAQSRKLSDCLLDAYVKATGLSKRDVWETDSMTGNNWASMPSCLFEMGFMSNPEEDRQMADPTFQEKMVQGLADGVEAYFNSGD